jgi:multiple sugar transport system permease protein
LIGLGIEGLPWLQSSKWALLCVIIVSVWRYVGWAMVFYWVALQGVPKELREAALMDGASGWGVFKSVTLPLISPTSFFLFIILWLQSFQAYDQINILTQGGPSGSTRTLLYMYYQSAFDRYNVGEASAVALVLVFIAALFSLVSVTVTRRSVHYLQ